MKSISPLVIVFAFLLLCSCQKQKPVVQTPPTVSSQSSTKEIVPVNDTLYETQYLYTHDEYDHDKQQSEFKVGEDVYKAYTESYSLNDSSLVEIITDSINDRQTSVTKIKCHNHVYKIRLTKNGKQVFQKQFTKLDFLKLERGGFIKESAPDAPNFRGVTADGKVLFDILFCLPDSDFGAVAFFSTDLKGNLLQLEPCGGDCDGVVETSPNNQYYLTCENLYGPNGYVFPILKPDVATTAFLSDTTFMVVYDYKKRLYNKETGAWEEETDDKANNLLIYHVNGRKLAGYRYDGFHFELGYIVPMEVLREQNLVLLLESEKNEVQTISISNPQVSKAVHLKSLPKLNKKAVEPGWKEVSLWNHLGEKLHFYLAADTLKAYHVSKEHS